MTFTQNPNDPTFFTEGETGAIFITRPGQSIESLLDEIANPPPVQRYIPDRVSRRQFRLQLIDDGLLSTVEGWIASQDVRTQAAYADSGTFLRSDEMLQRGFMLLEFDAERIDKFFSDAAAQ